MAHVMRLGVNDKKDGPLKTVRCILIRVTTEQRNARAVNSDQYSFVVLGLLVTSNAIRSFLHFEYYRTNQEPSACICFVETRYRLIDR